MGSGGAAVIALRDYQRQARAALESAWHAGHRRILLVAPTGAGKTTIAADLIAGAAAKGTPVIFLAHRTELIDQAAARFAAFGIHAGIIQGTRPTEPEHLVQVASVATLNRRALPPARLIVIDEAHRAIGPSYRRIVKAYPDATVVGLTATPIRLDGRGLGDGGDGEPGFEHLVEAATIGELVARGVLHRPRVFAPAVPDLAGVRTLGGDFNRLQLAEAMDKPQLVGDVVATWQRLAGGQRTVAFAASEQIGALLGGLVG